MIEACIIIGISIATGLMLYSMIAFLIFTNEKFVKFYMKRIIRATKDLTDAMANEVAAKTEESIATSYHMEIV